MQVQKVLLPDLLLSEFVDAFIEGDEAVISMVPAFNEAVNVHDRVRCETREGEMVAVELLSSAGWANIGLRIDDEHRDKALPLLSELERNGCVVVSRKPIQANVGVPPQVFSITKKLVERATDDGIWKAAVIKGL